MKHTRLTHENCNDESCNICNLFICAVCGGAEASLPTECPGIHMTIEQEEAVLQGKADYEHIHGWEPPSYSVKN